MESSDLTNTIITTINTIFQNMFSSIDNSLYSSLDEIVFIDDSILNDNIFKFIYGTSSSYGLLLVANSLLLGFIIYYSIKYFLSHIYLSKIESPFQFIFKLIIFGILMNYSYFIIEKFINIFSLLTLSIKHIGELQFNTNINFSTLILKINSSIGINQNVMDIFSIDGLIKSTLSLSLLSLLISYSFRYIMIKIFILITPFAMLSLCLDSTATFFKSWFKNLISLLFIQIIVSLILILLFSMDFSTGNLLSKILYVGALQTLIKANSIVKEIFGGLSTAVSQTVDNWR